MEKDSENPIDNMMKHVEKNSKEPKPEKKLAFDPVDGSLIITDNPKKGEIVVDQIYKDGFFCNHKAA